ncbi:MULTISPECIES: SAM-dependent methyltransferase TehB [unclassified Gilliamella]|uniref:SAM-dependent methyltransferase TehB n=1 Tax=unclassified Gilliamella TaxID=2685620 RepID=UPI00226A9E7C|nr:MULTISPECIES: SAM-dependent methyltransferase TehB [unclassified Gilliamella]MCX8597907.1 SAM-dependent methyltransferase TehB [Gilliamella sp. B3493]MCX8599518.1 SAM-dependent methyltransferase TehB [Gilliamella sp. B3486]MCX8689851.1 SAM-dependent methyltransferase TehB [Gilliamella sp. B2973]MCX8705507.1 SAM-dependent methyltransferase TehB [Gilliamella sp. B3127]
MMKDKDLVCYKTLPVWDTKTLPDLFREKHNTQLGTWAKLNIIKGHINFDMLTEQGDIVSQYVFDVQHQPPFIEPQQWHRIAQVSDDLQCQLAFYCQPEDYSQKKYQMTKTHSDVLEVCQIIQVGKALDLGCGSGRNSLYLQLLGFDVDAVDKSEMSISNLQEIIANDHLSHINASIYDINQANLKGNYDLIISTVVMMFLQPDRIPDIIHNMQNITKTGGYNLIVCAMSTDDFPCTVGFSFTFKENELLNYYQNWDILKYNEDVGELHKTDINGNRIKLRFATLIAKKR